MSDTVRAEGSRFEAEWVSLLQEGPRDLTTGEHQAKVTHPSGRIEFFSIKGRAGDGPVVLLALSSDGDDESFIHPEVMWSLTKLASLSTMPLVKWDGYVDQD